MKVVVAIDSFKGSLSSCEAGEAAKRGIQKAISDAEVTVYSVADGGEGTREALMNAINGRIRSVIVSDPLGRRIDASYGISSDGNTAVIEMAAAAGLPLLSVDERNPMNTTTYGVGEMIMDALNVGCRRFLIGLGGSATNDGGVGMLQALGFSFFDIDGNAIDCKGSALEKMHSISADGADARLAQCDFKIAVDVNNPLCGPRGCSAVFAPQKGADEKTVRQMDDWLSGYARLTQAVFPDADANMPGAGAAGGMGFACATYLGAILQPGIKMVLDEIGIESAIKTCDIVVTGEGRLDEQSVMGKTPVGVAALGKKYDKTVIAFSGCVTQGASVCNEHGIDAYFPILGEVGSLNDALRPANAKKNLERSTEQAFRLIKKVRDNGTENNCKNL
ncbi:MAG: glycerate kinase [Clostridia bacterium]|nr:glycerate kinase [Clostridia bacterium]